MGLFSSLKNYPKLKNYISLWEDFSEITAFNNLLEFRYFLINTGNVNTDIDFDNVEDWSIGKIFPDLNSVIKFNNSSFISYELCNISRFNLPKEYTVICPYTGQDHIRSMNEFEIDSICSKYENVVILGKNCKIKNCSAINLINKTSLLESIEIVKQSKRYYGIDSFLSVVASMSNKDITVKSSSIFLDAYKNIYYGNRDDYSFIRESIPT
jgi:hypothetical protein